MGNAEVGSGVCSFQVRVFSDVLGVSRSSLGERTYYDIEALGFDLSRGAVAMSSSNLASSLGEFQGGERPTYDGRVVEVLEQVLYLQ